MEPLLQYLREDPQNYLKMLAAVRGLKPKKIRIETSYDEVYPQRCANGGQVIDEGSVSKAMNLQSAVLTLVVDWRVGGGKEDDTIALFSLPKDYLLLRNPKQMQELIDEGYSWTGKGPQRHKVMMRIVLKKGETTKVLACVAVDQRWEDCADSAACR